MEWLTAPFEQSLTQRALLEVLLLALLCGPLGTWIVHYRYAYAAESLAHGMLPGLIVASLAGAPLALGAAGGTVLAASLTALARRLPRIGADSAVAVSVTTLFGLGALFALSPATPARLGELLFGDLLGVNTADLLLTAALVALGLLGLSLYHRRLKLVAFDRETAAVLGTRVAHTEFVLMALLAVTVVASVQALGSLLVVALVVAPAVCAGALSRSLKQAFLLATLLAAVGGTIGLYLSYYLDSAAGASVALVLATLTVIGLVRSSPVTHRDAV